MNKKEYSMIDERVLEEAEDDRIPLCERLSFASIYQSNLISGDCRHVAKLQFSGERKHVAMLQFSGGHEHYDVK